MLGLGKKGGGEEGEAAEALYKSLQEAGLDVLLDDRPARPGVKFKDADLFGIPVRVAIGSRGLAEGVVEVKLRDSGEVDKVPIAEAALRIKALVDSKYAQLQP